MASPASLALPAGQFTTVAVAGIQDPDGDPITVTVTAIGQDESIWHGPCPDGVELGDTADLRVVRRDHHRGRVYRLSFRADDGRGGQCAGRVVACVAGTPGAPCSDDGASVDSSAPACTGACAQACGVERTLGHATCSTKVPPKLKRLIARARRAMLRSAGGKDNGSQVANAMQAIGRAARLLDRARTTGRLPSDCAGKIGQLLGDARTGAEQTALTLAASRGPSRSHAVVRRAPTRSAARGRRPEAAPALRRRPPSHRGHAHGGHSH